MTPWVARALGRDQCLDEYRERMLAGRREERARIDTLIAGVRAGRGGALALLGDPGIGKTALLDYARATAQAVGVVATKGVESEFEVPFAGLVEVLRPLLGRLSRLPESQAGVVRTMLALGPPRPFDRLAAGASVLALLAAAGEEQPLLVLVDDAHWLDTASGEALLFAAGRLSADPVVVMFASRDGRPTPFEGAGIQTVRLTGLDREDAARLVEGRVPPVAVDRIVELTCGNPLALLELPATLSQEQLLSRAPPGQPLRLSDGIERAFADRAVLLGEQICRAVLVAAADESGSLETVAAALAALGGDMDQLRAAEDAGLLSLDGPTLSFRHPLVRAAVYQRAAPSQRREVHRALADALEGDDFRRAWHAGAAATGYDADAASALRAMAEICRARGGYSAAAAAFERGARLTDAREGRAALFAEAADAAWLAGRGAQAGVLIGEGLACRPGPATRAELLALRGRIGLYADDQQTAFDTLLEAAQLAAPTDAARATEFLVEAIAAGIHLGGQAAQRIASALDGADAAHEPLRELMIAEALLVAGSIAGRPEGVDRLNRALDAAEEAGCLEGSAVHLFWAGRARFSLGQNDDAATLARRALQRARQDAALAVVPQALALLAFADFDRGSWRSAYGAAGEAVDMGTELEQESTVCACVALLAELDSAAGNEEPCRAAAAAAISIANARGLGLHRERAERALGRLELVLGRSAEAIERLEGVQRRLDGARIREQNVTPLWDLVEAYARAGAADLARGALARGEETMPPALPSEGAVIERCRGIVAAEDGYEPAFEKALALHEIELFPFERARTQLDFGERLRRSGQKKRAREHLYRALATFEALGAAAWARRAGSELEATGERRRSGPDARQSLTPREMQVALAVAGGASNAEVAAALFLTPKTVEYHLTRVYRKLGLRSRTDLVRWAMDSGWRP